MFFDVSQEALGKNLLTQLENFWSGLDEAAIIEQIPKALDRMNIILSSISRDNKYVWRNEAAPTFSSMHSVQYAIFLYLLSNSLYKNCGVCIETESIYYLNKIMHACDWFYAIDLPELFYAEHPLGSVLGRAEYGSRFFLYQGCTVGGNRDRNNQLSYLVLGENVLMYANSSILGNSHIGNCVIVSAGAQIVNEIIPDNCIVFGKTPNLIVKQYSRDEIMRRYCVWESR